MRRTAEGRPLAGIRRGACLLVLSVLLLLPFRAQAAGETWTVGWLEVPYTVLIQIQDSLIQAGQTVQSWLTPDSGATVAVPIGSSLGTLTTGGQGAYSSGLYQGQIYAWNADPSTLLAIQARLDEAAAIVASWLSHPDIPGQTVLPETSDNELVVRISTSTHTGYDLGQICMKLKKFTYICPDGKVVTRLCGQSDIILIDCQ